MQDIDLTDPLYKGCLAPSTVRSVPLVPFIIGAVFFAQLTLLSFYFIGLSAAFVPAILGIFAFMWASQISRNDEHRLLQYMLKIQILSRQGVSRKFWGAVSFSPLRPRAK